MVPVLGLGATAAICATAAVIWSSARDRAARPAGEETDRPVSGGGAADRRDPLDQVARLRGRSDPTAVNELIQIYARWAGDQAPGALDARKAAVEALLAHPSVDIGVQAVLTAVQMDQTPRRQDPMWPILVHGVASLWDAVTITRGRDLLLLEARAKPRDVLLESLAEVRPEKLSDEQRSQLVSDLIDLYPTLTAEQKPAVDRALTALAGSDLVEILAGRGLGQDSHLKAAVEERRAQEAASRALRPAGSAAPKPE